MQGHILIIDDDGDSRALLGSILEHLGLSTAMASNGAEGLEGVEKQRPDLIILDLMMPRMSGFEMLTRLRQQVDPPIPVVIMSSLATPSYDMHRLPGVVGTLQKGNFTMKDVREMVERILGTGEASEAQPPGGKPQATPGPSTE